MRRQVVALLGAVLVLLSCGEMLNTKGTVTGGIRPCSGLHDANLPHYGAGTVTVLKGRVTWKDSGQGYVQSVFPTAVAARENVDTNATYRFVLEPGQYVLTAHFSGSNVTPFTEITVQPGDDQLVDIPNMCR